MGTVGPGYGTVFGTLRTVGRRVYQGNRLRSHWDHTVATFAITAVTFAVTAVASAVAAAVTPTVAVSAHRAKLPGRTYAIDSAFGSAFGVFALNRRGQG
jgi:hypothetical protein